MTSNNKGTGYTIQLGELSGAGTLRTSNANSVRVGGTDTFQIGALNTNTTFSGTISGNGRLGLRGLAASTGSLTLSGGTYAFSRIDLASDTGVRPPSVGLAQEGIAVEQRRVEQRHRQPRRPDKVAPFHHRGTGTWLTWAASRAIG